MFRLLPLFPILIFFGLYFFSVEFLTLQKSQFNELGDEIIMKKKVIEIIENEDFQKSKPQIKSIENKTVKNEKENKKTKDVLDTNDNKKLTKFYIQYGAFSTSDGTDLLITKIESSIKKKFQNFKLVVETNKTNNLFRLVYNLNDKRIAKEICVYSKNINIECYVQTRK